MSCDYCSDLENQDDICTMVSDLGSFHCPICGREIKKLFTNEEVKDFLNDLREQKKLKELKETKGEINK